MRRFRIAVTLASVSMSSLALAQSQKVFTPSGSSGVWHQGSNWFPTGTPTTSNDVLIPDGKTCTVTGSVDAEAKSVEVESGATLEVIDGLTLYILTPPSHSFDNLVVDGLLTLYDEEQTLTAVLEFGMTGGTKIVEISGAGDVFGGPANLLLDASNRPDRVHVGAGVTFSGSWLIPNVAVDNDGTFVAGAGETIEFVNTAPGNQYFMSGDGTFQVNGSAGYMLFDELSYATSAPTFAPSLVVSAGTMQFAGDSFAFGATVSAGGTIAVSGGSLDFDNGFDLIGDGTSAVDMTVSGGTVNSDAEADLVTVNLVVTGGLIDVPTNIGLSTGGSMLVEGGEVDTPYLHTESPSAYTLTVDGGTVECDFFFIQTADINVESGLFLVNGATNELSESSGLDITISGGSMKVGGGYDGDSTSNLTITGGTLEIIASETNDLFKNVGEFYFDGGTIKVKQGEEFIAF